MTKIFKALLLFWLELYYEYKYYSSYGLLYRHNSELCYKWLN